ncbi:MAG: hypothetical protein QOG01_2294 [Pseudonocardiales bacterium]|jgi:hypothetical protein|nr:hypothetical protein [Pseudonocardiales bacterium]
MSTDVIAPVQPTSLDLTPVSADRCATCPHDVDQHDRISLRYCTATAAGALTRGCICPPS